MENREEPIGEDDPGVDVRGTLLYERVRRGFGLLIVAVTAMAVAELSLRPGEDPRVTLLQVAFVAALLALTFVLRRCTTRRQLIGAALLSAVLSVATSLGVALVTQQETTSLIVLVSLAMGTAAFLPWGWPPQALLVAVIGVAFPIEIALNHGGIGVEQSRELGGFFAVLAASIFVARELEGQRRLTRVEQRRRRARETDLERQRHFLRQVIDINPHLVFARDRGHRFTLANQAIAELYGRTVEELIGRSDTDFSSHVDELARFHRDDLEVMDSGEELVIPEEVVTDFQGAQRWLRVVKRPLRDGDGTVDQVLGVATDITEYKLAQAALGEAADVAEALRRVSEGIIGAMNRPDLLERLCRLTAEAVNADSVQMWRFDRERGVCQPVCAAGEPAERWNVLRLLEFSVAKIEHLIPEAEQAGAKWFPIERFEPPLLRIGPGVKGIIWISLRRGGEVVGNMTAKYVDKPAPPGPRAERIARGISHLASIALENARLHDELERANRLKSEFMATMSHELRTPLNVILGYTGLVLEGAMGGVAEEQATALRRVNESAMQLLDLINATLDVTRLETGLIPFDFSSVQLSEILADVEGRTREARTRKGLEFHWDRVAGCPAFVTDAVKLRIVLTNLVGNALKFTQKGAVTVAAREDDGWIEIDVSDSGVGIAPEACDLIFEPFRQADSTIGTKYGGVGLGLFIVKRLVEALGGSVRVESELGRGTTFRVRLPKQPHPEAPVPRAV